MNITSQIGWSQSLVERLGYKATDRLLIINNDDAGMCHAANQAALTTLFMKSLRITKQKM